MNTQTSKNPSSTSSGESDVDDFFLPDFCNVRMVFAIVLIGELLAIILTLAPFDTNRSRWEDLGMISLFIQWVALISAGVLCITRRWLARMNDRIAATTTYILLILTATIVSEATYWAVRWIMSGGMEPLNWYSGFLFRNLGITTIVSAIALRYFYVQHQWMKNLEAKSQARIQALQARIRPHFLFNSLNTIASLARTQPEVAEEATEDLADLFRGTLSDAGYEVSLKDEWELSRRYLRIEELRMGERLKVEWDIDVPDNALIPQLTIQPLIENAIYHGLEYIGSGGIITIRARLVDNLIVITMTNPVPEYSPPKLRASNKMAQENIKQRLSAVYGHKGILTARKSGTLYELVLSFPYIVSRT